MRVRTRDWNPALAPAAVRPYLGQTLVTTGRDYDVHAVAIYEGVSVVQVIDDLGYPSWRPAWIFDVVDNSIPQDWICSMFDEEPSLVLGPSFVAESLDSYAAMVELTPEQVEKFWKRVALPGAD